MDQHKPVHSLVLDAGPIIKNEPAVSSLLQQAECLFTVPSIISEIKDAQTKSRVATTLRPFLTVRTPNPKSIKTITDFARKTGDLAVLSRPDIEIIALTYDLECERNKGDWRLRSTPGQKRLNGSAPVTAASTDPVGEQVHGNPPATDPSQESTANDSSGAAIPGLESEEMSDERLESALPQRRLDPGPNHSSVPLTDGPNDPNSGTEISAHYEDQAKSHSSALDSSNALSQAVPDADQKHVDGEDESESDSDGWITPSNLKRRQAEDEAASTVDSPEPATMQAAVLTSDFAMQNVILQMNLNLLSSSLKRVKHLKTFVLRCHACFQTTKDMTKQFCPRCGQPALTRVACSTNAQGEFKLHLKKNMQWNTRGDRFSVPKPAHGSANRRIKGGGKGGWGHDLILAEDQKEYERARTVEKRQKERSLMDEDYLPSILTGDRSRAGGQIKVGAGRNVNSRKR